MVHDPEVEARWERCLSLVDHGLRDLGQQTVISVEREVRKGVVLPVNYTVGLHAQHLPELIIVGVPHGYATRVLEALADELRKLGVHGLKGVVGVPLEVSTLVVCFKPITEVQEYLPVACKHAGRAVNAYQVVWADPQRRFPWELFRDRKYDDHQVILF